MAFNPAMTVVKEAPNAEDKALMPVSPAMVAAFRRMANKREYYMEYWKLGDPPEAIMTGQFSTANIKHVVKKVVGSGKYSIVFLMRLADQKVLWNRRTR